jgi:hypothetical protein
MHNPVHMLGRSGEGQGTSRTDSVEWPSSTSRSAQPPRVIPARYAARMAMRPQVHTHYYYWFQYILDEKSLMRRKT